MAIRNKEQNSVLSRLAYIDKQMTNPKLTDKEIKVLKLREKNLLEMLEDGQDTFDSGGMAKKKKRGLDKDRRNISEESPKDKGRDRRNVSPKRKPDKIFEKPKNRKKKKVPMIAISVGMAEFPKNRKKEHRYFAGGAVMDNLTSNKKK